LKADWQVRINSKTYQVHSPPRSLVGGDHAELLGVDKTKLQRVRDAVTAKGAQQQTITLAEYHVLAEDLGLNKDEARAVLSDLHGLGVVLYFEHNQELSNTVFLQPKKISQQIEEALNLPYIRVSHQEKIKLVQQLKDQLIPLEAERQSLEDTAWRRSNIWAWGGLAFLCAQFVLFARLTWWESDWDVMEPITYFTTVTETVMAGYLYYILTSVEYTNDDARTILYKRKLQKLIKKNGFDDEKYQGLKQQIRELVNEIKFFDPKVAAELEVQ
jgi:polyhydroxyalkanoate synthesis regulator phasin